ncbi:MAG TPA: YbaN family protein [Steroidobacter sp.]|jgi:uncharacterized membrane protein YbaN (DUF454 family)|nr:YbaN family protein [Steroidobacteraceae bacterium]HLS80061.1 YbaN family protein [Steroidobacter sp.]
MQASTVNLIWRAVALVCVALGLIGLAAPILPTVPFLIAAAWAGGKGWPQLERRLLEDPRFGLHIRRWRERGAVPRKAKIGASLMMITSASGVQLTPTPLWLRIAIPVCLLAVAIWLWRRPEPVEAG